ncbi:MAG: ABC transporter substrate binding protein [Spirochaetota bacterium]
MKTFIRSFLLAALCSISLLVIAAPLSAQKKILVIDTQKTGWPADAAVARKKYLDANGFVEGKDLTVVSVSVENDETKAAALLAEELPKNYNVIVLNGTIPARAAKKAAFGTKQPFVFAGVTDPVGVGIIADFKTAPTANFTGVSFPVPVRSRLAFIKQVMPKVKKIGLIYADMPQSHSYKTWLDDAIAGDPSLKGMQVIYRMVPAVTGETGPQQMADAAKAYVQELDAQVDLFISANDQMGVSKQFPMMVYQTAKKPLCGLGRSDVMDGLGATMSIYPVFDTFGVQSGRMIAELLKGKKVSDLVPEWPKQNGVAFDLGKAKKFGISVPVGLLELAGPNVVRAAK